MDSNQPIDELPFRDPAFKGSHFEAFAGQLLAAGLRIPLDDQPGREAFYELADVRPRKASGVAQGGRDFEANAHRLTAAGRSDAPPEPWWFECKHRAEVGDFTLPKAQETVRACPSPEAKRKFLLVSHAVAWAEEFEQAYPTWQVWDSRRLLALVLTLPAERAARLLHRCFGSYWVKKLVPGAAAAAPLLSASAFFETPLQSQSLFFHPEKFLGPPEPLDGLLARLVPGGPRVVLLLGGGGAGKSRLLLEVARRLESAEPARRVLFANPNARPFTVELEYFDADAVLVLDDAHLYREECRAVLAAAQARPNVQLVLAARPQVAEDLIYDARRTQFDATQIARAEMPASWKTAELRALLEELLPDTDRASVRNLATLSDGSPLLATLAAQLIRHRQLAPQAAIAAPDFRDELFRCFARANIEPLLGEARESEWLALLEMLSALSPVEWSHEFAEQAGKFLGWDAAVLQPRLERLMTSGVVQRAGGWNGKPHLRVWPDVFAEHLVLRACATPALGPTTFASHIQAAFNWTEVPGLLRNLAMAAWRIDKKDPAAARTITTQPVAEFRESFDQAPWFIRGERLRQWSSVAFFLPDDTLELVEHALTVTTAPPDETASWLLQAADPQHGRQSMLDTVPPLLGSVASHYPDARQTRALDLLWRLSRERHGGTTPWRDSTVKQLADVVVSGLKYRPDTVVGAWRWVRAKIESELAAGGETLLDGRSTLAELFTPFVMRTVEDHHSEGMTVYFGARLVREEATRAIRQEVFAAAEKAAALPDPRFAAALLPFLRQVTEPGVHPVAGPWQPGLEWQPDRLRAIAILGTMLRTHSTTVLHFLVRRFLHGAFYHNDTAEFVAAVNAALPQVRLSLELDTLNVLCGGPDDIGPNLPTGDVVETYHQRERLREDLAAATARRLIEQSPDARVALRWLHDLTAQAERFNLAVSYAEFGLALEKTDPDYAARLSEAIIGGGDETIDHLWRWLHDGGSASDASRQARLQQARAALATARPSLLAALVAGYARWLGQPATTEEERTFGLKLAARSEGKLAGEWLTALRVEANSPFAYYGELIRALPGFTPDQHQLRMGFYLVVALTELPRDEQRRAVVAALLARFVTVPALGDFVDFRLKESATRYFDEVRRFLYARLAHSRAKGTVIRGYEVIPHHFGFLPPIDEPENLPAWLEEGWQEVLAGDPHPYDPAHGIFRKIFACSTEALERFLSEHVAAATAIRELQSVAAILQQAPREETPWLPAVLRAALVRARSHFPAHAPEIEEALLDACVPSVWGFDGDQPDAKTRTALAALRQLASEWAHDPVMAGFFARALATAEQRFRSR